MFDPEPCGDLLKAEDKDLALLPSTEDHRHEYKSSRTENVELAGKIACASSGASGIVVADFLLQTSMAAVRRTRVSPAAGRQAQWDCIEQAVLQAMPVYM